MDQWPASERDRERDSDSRNDVFSQMGFLRKNQEHVYTLIQTLIVKVDGAVSAAHSLAIQFAGVVSESTASSSKLERIDKIIRGDDRPEGTMLSRLTVLEKAEAKRLEREEERQQTREEEGRKWKWWLLGILGVLIGNILIGGYALWRVSLIGR